jgi:flagellar hook-length control protein FliK
VPSIASDVSATLPITSSLRTQAPSATQASDAQPFAALLDASTTAPDAVTAHANPRQVAAQAPASPGNNAGYADHSETGPAADANLVADSTDGPSLLATPPRLPNASSNTTGGVRVTPASTGDTPGKVANGGNVTAKPVAKAPTNSNADAQATPSDNTPATATNSGSIAPRPTESVTTNAKVASTTNSDSSATDAATTSNTNIVVAANAIDSGVRQNSGVQQAAVSPTALSRNNSKSDSNNAGSDTDLNASATAASQTQVATDPAQPIAAAVANGSADPAPAPTNAPAASIAIGEPTKAPAKSFTPVDADQGVSTALDEADNAPAKQAPSATKTDDIADAASGSSDQGAKVQGARSSSSQQVPTQAVDDTAVSPQTDEPAPAVDTDHPVAQAAASSAMSSSGTAAAPSNGQEGAGTTKSDIGGLPNFGFTASSAATPSTPAAAPLTAATAAAVPIAGLAVAIAARAQAGSNQFEIKLAPPELGPIKVQLDFDRDGQVTSHVTVERADTLQLLQSQQPHLERAFQEAGLKTADNGLQFTLRDQSFAGQNNGAGTPSATAQLVLPEPDLAPIAATQIYARAGLGSGVDIRV